jgi:lipopolysaccharide/colanic/teichoic acid biosynthesis glycosyltransferase
MSVSAVRLKEFLHSWEEILKRSLDILFGLAGFAVFLPVFLLVPLLIKWDDGGSVFFKQMRLGRFKRPFLMYKFRTIREGKVTGIGRWLRSTGLDELPQFFNVIKGDMSITGPRALTMDDIVRLGWDKRFYIGRWHVKPGITGLAQLYAGRSAHHSWLFDKTYLKQRSLIMDLQIVGWSFLMNLIGKYRVRAWLHRRADLQRSNKMNWQQWKSLFAERRDRTVPGHLTDYSYFQWSKPLAKSLAIFQLGESGGGTIVQQVQGSRIDGVDGAYRQAMALFVDEEHRHADILALCVKSLGGDLIKRNWTARMFVAGRRLMGLRFKVLVLLAAEVVGICYYKLLALRLPDGQLRCLLEELAADEEAHLQFHSAFLRMCSGGTLHTFHAMVFKVIWRLVTFSAAIVVSIDHRRALNALDIPLGLVWQRWMYLVRETEAQVMNPRPDYHFLQKVNLEYA